VRTGNYPHFFEEEEKLPNILLMLPSLPLPPLRELLPAGRGLLRKREGHKKYNAKKDDDIV
jgi:hypothetical protein